MEILTSQQMRAIDRRAIGAFGLPEVVLMENAGLQLLTYLCGAYPDLAVRRLLLLCGPGNNGGDTFVLARHLRNRGHRFEALLFGRRREVRGSAAMNLKALEKLGVSPREVRTPADWRRALAALAECDLVIDGILGTGLSRPVQGLLARVFADVNPGPIATTRLPGSCASRRGRARAESAPSGPSGRPSVITSMARRTMPFCRLAGTAAVTNPQPARKAPRATMRAAPPLPRDPATTRACP